ncbi:MAG: infB, partial [Gammaproteobacteria bacterium]|nr:infB [Gammaproteobacteria bacterium]
MADITVKQLATIYKIPVDHLVNQFKEAGIAISGPEHIISDEQRHLFMSHLQKSHASQLTARPDRVTLKRKRVEALEVEVEDQSQAGQGRLKKPKIVKKVVNVEFRKKRTYVKRSSIESDQEPEESAVLTAEMNDTHEPMVESVVTEVNTVATEIPESIPETSENIAESTKTGTEPASEPVVEAAAPVSVAAPKSPDEANKAKEKPKDGYRKKDKQKPGRFHTAEEGGDKLNRKDRRSGETYSSKKRKDGRRDPHAINELSKHGFARPTEPMIR